MKRVLADLYYGRVSPVARRPERSDEEREISRQIEEEKRYFIQKMSVDDCRRFQALEELYTRFGDREQSEAFSYGFALAAQLMAAVFTEAG